MMMRICPGGGPLHKLRLSTRFIQEKGLSLDPFGRRTMEDWEAGALTLSLSRWRSFLRSRISLYSRKRLALVANRGALSTLPSSGPPASRLFFFFPDRRSNFFTVSGLHDLVAWNQGRSGGTHRISAGRPMIKLQVTRTLKSDGKSGSCTFNISPRQR